MSTEEPLEKYQVSVTVFATAPGVDAGDASNRLEFAIRKLLRESNDGYVLTDDGRNGTNEDMPIHLVMDTGVAAGNGYLWVRPTQKAKREDGRH